MSTALFRRLGDSYAVGFRYDPTLVELIKDVVPSHARSWNKATREWTVTATYAPHLASAIRQRGHQVVGLETEPPPRTGTDQWARLLLRRVGPTRREPVFRALTRVLHPDNAATGDTTLQRELNLAREQLTEGDR